MSVTIPAFDISDTDAAAITAEIATMSPVPAVADFVTAATRSNVIAPIVARQAQYRLDATMAAISPLMGKLARLTTDQQALILAGASAAIDVALGS